MKTRDEVIQKVFDLRREIHKSKSIERTKAQDLAVSFAERIAKVSPTIFLLTDAGAVTEAFTVCRLLLEHFFNFSALLHTQKHFDILYEHSLGEPGRQLKKIMQNEEKLATLTPEHAQWAAEYLSHPDRENDPKTGLNWEQIALSGEPAGLYTAYKQYSCLYAHSTLASLSQAISEKEIEDLHENVWTIVEISRLLLREKLIKPANQPKA